MFPHCYGTVTSLIKPMLSIHDLYQDVYAHEIPLHTNMCKPSPSFTGGSHVFPASDGCFVSGTCRSACLKKLSQTKCDQFNGFFPQ